MKRSFHIAGNGATLTLLLGMLAALSLDCGTIDANGIFGLETCDILNCDGLFFGNLADDHDDMAGMDDVDAHGDDHLDGADDHDEDGDDDKMDDMDGHDDDMGDHDEGDDDDMGEHTHDDDHAQEEETHDATEGDNGSGQGVARRL